MRLTLSNWITLLRILLVPVFMAFLLSDLPYGTLMAALVFALAAGTDTLDGYLARLRREKTKLGAILDPFADKLLVSAALISLVQLERLSAWIAVLIISREFLVSALRVIAAGHGQEISASFWGKAKTLSQISAILVWVMLPEVAFQEKGAEYTIAVILMAAAIILTVYSAADYLRLFLMRTGGSDAS